MLLSKHLLRCPLDAGVEETPCRLRFRLRFSTRQRDVCLQHHRNVQGFQTRRQGELHAPSRVHIAHGVSSRQECREVQHTQQQRERTVTAATTGTRFSRGARESRTRPDRYRLLTPARRLISRDSRRLTPPKPRGSLGSGLHSPSCQRVNVRAAVHWLGTAPSGGKLQLLHWLSAPCWHHC